jgi:farnesyl-diphosphate farnesyltransferase
LVAEARGLPPLVTSRGLRWESAAIVEMAARLLRRLRHGDPLATRVKLRKRDFLAAFVIGVSRGLRQ